MQLADPSMSLLAASGGDTVKLFDVAAAGDPCVLSYSPSPGSLVNSLKWNHTNLVVASAGEDKRISLWRKNGQSLGTIPPLVGTDNGDNIEESIQAINFSNKGSRYICSGGSGQVVRIWDLQRKRCIKWLKGHTSTITGAMYNCKDEHLASVSVSGDLIVHNLASGARAAELKDPNQQVLRVLDYSRMSRHLLVTSGDDGSIHLWDTTGRTPKVSWSKQHSAPTAGISFSPSSDKTVASLGLDKKLYTYDTGSRRPSSCISYEAPFSSVAYRDDGLVLACGTGVGRVVFYDVRGKPQPLTVLHAYSSSEAVTSLCWQRSKSTAVNENCSAEMVLLGGSSDDSIVMPDPLPSVASSSLSFPTAVPGSRNFGPLGSNTDVPSLPATMDAPSPILTNLSSAEETPLRSHLRPGGSLPRLNPRRPGYNLRDDMDVFSPIVEVQPMTPSLDKLWDGRDGLKRENLSIDKKPSSLFPMSTRRFPFSEDSSNDHPISDWKPSLTSTQDDNRTSFALLGGTSPTPSAEVEDSVTPPEAWGGERLSDRYANLRQPANVAPRYGMLTSETLTSVSMSSNLQEQSASPSQTNLSSLANSTQFISSLRNKEVFFNPENPVGFLEQTSSSSMSPSLGTRGFIAFTNSEAPGSLTLPRRSYAERIGAASAFRDGALVSVGSPKVKKSGAETREDIGSSLLSRSELSNVPERVLAAINGGTLLMHKALPSEPQGSSFTLQLLQCSLEETISSCQKSAHRDMRNLQIEILRQFHMQQMEFSATMKLVLENQAEMMKEIKSLRKENQELRRLLYANLRQPPNVPPRYGMLTSATLTSVSMLSNLQEQPVSSSQTNLSSLANNAQLMTSLRNKEGFFSPENPVGFLEQTSSSSLSLPLGTRGFTAFTNSEAPGSSILPRRSYAEPERVGAASAFSDGAFVSVGSPKVKKSGAETREEIGSSLLSRFELSNVPEPVLPAINGGTSLMHKALPSEPQGSSFMLQLFQRMLEDKLDSFQKSRHEDTRNLCIEIWRQFHMQEMEFSAAMKLILENQAEMMKEIKSLRKENQELCKLL